MGRSWVLVLALGVLGGCADVAPTPQVGPPPSGPAESPSPAVDPPLPPAPPDGGTPPPPAPPTYPLACHPLYAEDLLPTFELELTPENWAALQREFQEDPSRETQFPATFRYDGEVHAEATVRLRGNNSSCGDKLQLAIAFNQVDPKGRFRGLRRLNLDHGGCHHLEERLALSFMRDVGLPAACANHARLVVNGAYEGLYANIEHLNQDFLKRQFPGAENDGNLWKSGNKLRTNESTPDPSRLDAFWAARSVEQLDALADLDEAVLEWAAEATLPARDNYWRFGWNYYLYEHPTRGFLFLPTDLDRSISLSPFGADDNFFRPEELQPTVQLLLADPAWNARYLAAVHRSIHAFDAAVLQARVDRWWAQIAEAAGTDPHVRYRAEDVVRLKEALHLRETWLRGWAERNPVPAGALP